MLKELNKKGMAIIMVSHDLSVLEEATHVFIYEKMIMFMLEKKNL